MLKPLLLASLGLVCVYLYRRLYHKRFVQYAHIPQPPSSLLLGHLPLISEFVRRGEADRHADYVFSEMMASIGNPPLMLLDLRPVNRPIAVVRSHEIAEQMTKATEQFPISLPRSPLTSVGPVIGERSILTAYGDAWKNLRKRFNPGFAPQHINTLIPCIVDKTSSYIRHLDSLCRSGAEFELVHLTIGLIFDIIGAVVMDTDLEAQHLEPSRKGELIRLYDELLATYSSDRINSPWWLTPRVVIKRKRLSQRINTLIGDIIYETEYAQRKGKAKASRSVLSLSLQNNEKLTPDLVGIITDQIKTFLFAGHDTTAIVLAWTFYELSRHPRTLRALREELDQVLGPDTDPEKVRERLLGADGPDAIRRLPYVNAVLKEVLRLHPPAGTSRTNEPNTPITVATKDGDEYLLSGIHVYVCASIIHRDPESYGDSADDFVPERWLRKDEAATTAQATPNGDIPAGGWRGFERGPRGCIGQDLAMFEMRIIIALIARRYDFSKVGLGEILVDDEGRPVLQENGQYAVKRPLYSAAQITSKPADGMRIKVHFAPTA